MRILGLETSCDETAISIIDATGDVSDTVTIKVMSNLIISQVKLHAKYGGVFPMLAKREHSKNLVPLLILSLNEAKLLEKRPSPLGLTKQVENKIRKILLKEPAMVEPVIELYKLYSPPKIDRIAVTYGPGLEPALWTAINLANVLKLIWGITVIPTNHMEGHIVSSILKRRADESLEISKINFPAIVLLISGGHTELILMSDFLKYKIIGQTRDDAVGEAFDKVARLLGLPYPGGPEISKLAEISRKEKLDIRFTFPRPMIASKDFDFSFSGLKTAVLYAIKKINSITPLIKKEASLEFENAVCDVLEKKTKDAVLFFNAKTIIVGGGVSANTEIRRRISGLNSEETPLQIFLPEMMFTTDNALMIATAGYLRSILSPSKFKKKITATGNLKL